MRRRRRRRKSPVNAFAGLIGAIVSMFGKMLGSAFIITGRIIKKIF